MKHNEEACLECGEKLKYTETRDSLIDSGYSSPEYFITDYYECISCETMHRDYNDELELA